MCASIIFLAQSMKVTMWSLRVVWVFCLECENGYFTEVAYARPLLTGPPEFFKKWLSGHFNASIVVQALNAKWKSY